MSTCSTRWRFISPRTMKTAPNLLPLNHSSHPAHPALRHQRHLKLPKFAYRVADSLVRCSGLNLPACFFQPIIWDFFFGHLSPFSAFFILPSCGRFFTFERIVWRAILILSSSPNLDLPNLNSSPVILSKYAGFQFHDNLEFRLVTMLNGTIEPSWYISMTNLDRMQSADNCSKIRSSSIWRSAPVLQSRTL